MKKKILSLILVLCVLTIGSAAGELSITDCEIRFEGNECTVRGDGAEFEEGVLTLKEDARYLFTGNAEDIRVNIECGRPVLVLRDLTMSCPGTLFAAAADVEFIAEDNISLDGDTFLTASGNVTISGSPLTVNCEKAVDCAGDLVIDGAFVTVNSTPVNNEAPETGSSLKATAGFGIFGGYDPFGGWDPFGDMYPFGSWDPFGDDFFGGSGDYGIYGIDPSYPYQGGESTTTSTCVKCASLSLRDGATLSVDGRTSAVVCSGKADIEGSSLDINVTGSGLTAGQAVTFTASDADITSGANAITCASLHCDEAVLSVTAMGYGVSTSDKYESVWFENGCRAVIYSQASAFYSAGDITVDSSDLVTAGPYNTVNSQAGKLYIESGTLMCLSNSSDMSSCLGKKQPMPVMNYRINGRRSVASGTLFSIADEDGLTLLAYKSPCAFNYVLFSSDLFGVDESYTVYLEGSCEGKDTAGWYYDDIRVEGARNVYTFVPSRSDISGGTHSGGDHFSFGETKGM